MSRIEYTSRDVHRSLWSISVPTVFLSILDYFGLFVGLGWLMAMSDGQFLPATFRLCSSVVSVLEATFGGLLSAIYVYANRCFGGKDFKATKHLVRLGFGVSLLVGTLIALGGHLFARTLLDSFGVEPAIKDQAARYLDVFSVGYFAVILHIYAGLLAKMVGDVTVMVQFRVVTFVTSLVITPICLALGAKWGLDPLHTAAAAAVLGRLAGLGVLLSQLIRRKVFPFKLGVDFLPRRVFAEWSALGKLAIAETINGFSLTASFFLFFLIVSYYERGTLAAVTIAQYLTGFFQTILLGVMGSLIPFVAQNAGAQNGANIRTGVRWMTTRVLAVCLPVSIACILLAPYFARLFASDPVLAAQTINYVRITAIPWAFLMASFPYIFAVVGLGDTRGTLWLTFWSMYLGNLLPMLLVLRFVGNASYLAATAEAAAHVITFVGCLAYYRGRERRLLREWQIPAATGAAGAPA
jgi:Na+-driven multidrug efflux pump